MKKKTVLILGAAAAFAVSCTNAEKSVENNSTKKSDFANLAAKEKPPVIQLEDSIALPKYVICMSDSSATISGISKKFEMIFGEIGNAFFAKQKLAQMGPPIAWYKSNKAPYFFDVGIATAKKPSSLPKPMFVKEIKDDSVSVAHFYGPYEKLEMGYTALSDWMKAHGHVPKGATYEIYVDDPVDANGKAKDPFKVRTDIVVHF